MAKTSTREKSPQVFYSVRDIRGLCRKDLSVNENQTVKTYFVGYNVKKRSITKTEHLIHLNNKQE
jgi:hypothetical protein